jgi:hypothetical protein
MIVIKEKKFKKNVHISIYIYTKKSWFLRIISENQRLKILWELLTLKIAESDFFLNSENQGDSQNGNWKKRKNRDGS